MIEKELRPALSFDVGAGAKGLREAFQDVAAETARAVSREAVLGVDEALRRLDEAAPKDKEAGGLLGRTRGAVRAGVGVVGIVAVALGCLVLALGIWLAIVLVKVRRSRRETTEREAGVARLADAVRAAAERPWGNELNALLRERLRAGDDAALGLVARQNKP
jgi:hypothetical protein